MSYREFFATSLMAFAFFFGAGNLIFPSYVGMQAGTSTIWAYLGFISVDVGLSFLAIAAIAVTGRAVFLTKDFYKWIGIVFWILVYAVIGPVFAVPRTASVAFDTGIKSLFGINSVIPQLIFTFMFFAMVYKFVFSPGKLVNTVGEILTPILLICLGALYSVMLLSPADPIQGPIGKYELNALGEGMLNGYLTMDTIGALAFGGVISSTIRSFGIKDNKELIKNILYVALFAGFLLAIVYMGLFYMGAISRNISLDATNGSMVLNAFVKMHFGIIGQIVLGLTIFLACITTAVGLISACSEFFHSIYEKFSYRLWALILCIVSFCIANIGLDQIIKLSIPVVFALYPLLIILIFAALIRQFCQLRGSALIISFAVTLVFSLIDALNSATDIVEKVNWISSLPLADKGLSWIIPGMIVFAIGVIVSNLNVKKSVAT